jgi:Ca2+-binding RTX toxin-like protein
MGADSLSGGLGNDTYLVNEAGDLVLEGMDEGTDRVLSAVTWTLGAHLEDLTLTGADAIRAYGNDSGNLLVGNLAANRMLGYGGNDLLDGGLGADRMVGGRGDDVYVVDDAADLVYEYVGEGQDTVMAAISLTLGRGLENLVLTGTAKLNGAGNAADNLLTGNSADNQLAGDAGNDILKGGLGNDTYVVARGDGADTLIDTDRTAGNTDVLRFLSGVSRDQLWFTHEGSNLRVSIIGTGTSVTISNWYAGTANRVEQICTSDGASTLLSRNVENLVNAMAALGARPVGATSLTSAEHARLDAVIAANWT